MTRLMFDDDKLRVRVCGGMHCAGNGGGRALEDAFQDALEEAGIAAQVELLRAHCLGACPDGPCVRIAGERFYHIQTADVPDLVRNEILPRLK